MAVELPFVAFALALPLVASGPRHQVLGLSLSIAGSWAAWNILAKASLGVAVSVVLAWSTPVAGILEGLDRLRVPRALTAIAGFMVRYLDVIMGELHRLEIARVSRGDDPRWAWQGKAVAATAGSLFVRCFERGERVHRAMLSRGFDGRFPAVMSISTRALVACGRLAGRGRGRGHVGMDLGAVTQPVRRRCDRRRRGVATPIPTEPRRWPGSTSGSAPVSVWRSSGRTDRVSRPWSCISTASCGRTAGSIAIDGLTIDDASLREIRRRVGVVFQDPDDQLFMPSVGQDVAFGPANLGFAGDELAARVDEALAAVGMADHADRPPHHLSLGQRRRVALATVLSMQPSLLVFDEPSANLDPMARHELAVAVDRLGLTTLVVTHDLAYAAELCDRALCCSIAVGS